MEDLLQFVNEYRTKGAVGKKNRKPADGEVVNKIEVGTTKKFVDHTSDAEHKKAEELGKQGKSSEGIPYDDMKGEAALKKLSAKGDIVFTKGGGRWNVDSPTENDVLDDVLKQIDEGTISKNKRRLVGRFQSESPFFIQGEAGWAKTSLIKSIAKKFGYHIITVYLDKAEATDLGGIPVPVQNETDDRRAEGLLEQGIAVPGWVAVIANNPKINFLLFFDEMNQARPDVMSALMPIVNDNVICGRHFPNYLVGAAGNYDFENKGGITELSGPLASRFGNIIDWESDTPETWADTMNDYLAPKYEPKVGKKIIKFLCDNVQQLFKNPREVENWLLKRIIKLKEKGVGLKMWTPKVVLEDMLEPELRFKLDDSRNAKVAGRDKRPDAKPAQKEAAVKLAEMVSDFIQGNETKEEPKKRKRGKINIKEEDRENLKAAMTQGYIETVATATKDGVKFAGKTYNKGDRATIKWGYSRENLIEVCCTEVDDKGQAIAYSVNKEQLDDLIDMFEEEDLKFKFETDKEWKDAGYVDPTTDEWE